MARKDEIIEKFSKEIELRRSNGLHIKPENCLKILEPFLVEFASWLKEHKWDMPGGKECNRVVDIFLKQTTNTQAFPEANI